MTAEKFREFVNAIRPNSDSAVAVWLEWADELGEYDSSHGEKPAGSYKTSEMFLDEFTQKFSDIRELYGDDVAGKVISLAEIGACPFPWEMKLAAEHLAAGGGIQDILPMSVEGLLEGCAEMEESGVLEDFSDILQEDGPSMRM